MTARDSAIQNLRTVVQVWIDELASVKGSEPEKQVVRAWLKIPSQRKSIEEKMMSWIRAAIEMPDESLIATLMLWSQWFQEFAAAVQREHEGSHDQA